LADVADDATEVDGGSHEFLEAGLFDGDSMLAGGEGVGEVLAVRVGDGFAFEGSGFILDEDLGVG